MNILFFIWESGTYKYDVIKDLELTTELDRKLIVFLAEMYYTTYKVITNPEKDTVIPTLEGFLEDAKKRGEDYFLVFYYTGHGVTENDRFYYVPSNGTPDEDRNNLNLDDATLNRVLKKYQGQQSGSLIGTLKIIDACMSGSVVVESLHDSSLMSASRSYGYTKLRLGSPSPLTQDLIYILATLIGQDSVTIENLLEEMSNIGKGNQHEYHLLNFVKRKFVLFDRCDWRSNILQEYIDSYCDERILNKMLRIRNGKRQAKRKLNCQKRMPLVYPEVSRKILEGLNQEWVHEFAVEPQTSDATEFPLEVKHHFGQWIHTNTETLKLHNKSEMISYSMYIINSIEDPGTIYKSVMKGFNSGGLTKEESEKLGGNGHYIRYVWNPTPQKSDYLIYTLNPTLPTPRYTIYVGRFPSDDSLHLRACLVKENYRSSIEYEDPYIIESVGTTLKLWKNEGKEDLNDLIKDLTSYIEDDLN